VAVAEIHYCNEPFIFCLFHVKMEHALPIGCKIKRAALMSMCHTIVQKRREVALRERIVVLQKGSTDDYDAPVVAVFRGSVSRKTAKEMIQEGRGSHVIIPYVSAFDVRSENTGRLNRKSVTSGSALRGVLSTVDDPRGSTVHVIYEQANENDCLTLGNAFTPVILERRLEQDDWIRWQRCNPPSPGEDVWTTDQFVVRKGRYEWDPLDWDPWSEVEKEHWEDLNGNEIKVRYWMHMSEDHKAEPTPPRLLYRHFEMPEISKVV